MNNDLIKIISQLKELSDELCETAEIQQSLSRRRSELRSEYDDLAASGKFIELFYPSMCGTSWKYFCDDDDIENQKIIRSVAKLSFLNDADGKVGEHKKMRDLALSIRLNDMNIDDPSSGIYYISEDVFSFDNFPGMMLFAKKYGFKIIFDDAAKERIIREYTEVIDEVKSNIEFIRGG